MNKKELLEEIAILKTSLHDSGKDLGEIRLESGIDLTTQPFLPEYLAFKAFNTKADGVPVTVYIKDKYSLSRPINEEFYYILCPDKQRVKVKLANMLHAIIVLESLGMDISVKKYYSEY